MNFIGLANDGKTSKCFAERIDHSSFFGNPELTSDNVVRIDANDRNEIFKDRISQAMSRPEILEICQLSYRKAFDPIHKLGLQDLCVPEGDFAVSPGVARDKLPGNVDVGGHH